MSVCKIAVLQYVIKEKQGAQNLKCKKRPMLLLMIYVDDTHKALINEATVPRVRHRAVKFKALSVTNSKQKSHYWVIKEIGTKSFVVQLLNPPSVVG